MGRYKNIKDDDIVHILAFEDELSDLVLAISTETTINKGWIVIHNEEGCHISTGPEVEIDCFDNKQDAEECYQELLNRKETKYVLIYKYDSHEDGYNRKPL